jgi:GABA permease
VVVVMLTSDSGRSQVWTSLIATGVLLVFWPLVRRNLRRRPDHASNERIPSNEGVVND